MGWDVMMMHNAKRYTEALPRSMHWGTQKTILLSGGSGAMRGLEGASGCWGNATRREDAEGIPPDHAPDHTPSGGLSGRGCR
jgi:hypothetical protein